MPGTDPHLTITAASRASNARWRGSYAPRQPGVMRPIAETWVASAITMPAPPAAFAPRFWTCQSSPSPSMALYWHIGDTTMRLRAVTERKVIGWNSSGVGILNVVLWGVVLLGIIPRGAV